MKTICEKCDDTGILSEFVGPCDCAAGRYAVKRGHANYPVNLDSLQRELEKLGYKPKMHKYRYNPNHVWPICGYAELDLTGRGERTDTVCSDGRWNIHSVSAMALLTVARHLVNDAKRPSTTH